MREYFYNSFPERLSEMTFSTPHPTVREKIADSSAIFFGGANWNFARRDLKRIPRSERPEFIYSLFMIVLTDQALYSCFRESYDAWRKRTFFPKFGYSLFGAHNENPCVILQAPVRERLVASNALLAMMPTFVDFYCEETKNCLEQYLPAVNVNRYFNAMLNDDAWKIAGEVVSEVRNRMLATLSAQGDDHE